MDWATSKKAAREQRAAPASRQTVTPSIDSAVTPASSETPSNTLRSAKAALSHASYQHCQDRAMLLTPSLSYGSHASMSPARLLSPAPSPPWAEDEDSSPSPPKQKVLESPDSPGYSERLAKAMRRDREDLHLAMRAVMSKPDMGALDRSRARPQARRGEEAAD